MSILYLYISGDPPVTSDNTAVAVGVTVLVLTIVAAVAFFIILGVLP